MSKQIIRVGTLFLRQTGDDYLAVARQDERRALRGKLGLKETNTGSRPPRFLVTRKREDSPHDSSQFVKLARLAARIRISQQTPENGRDELKEALDEYQLGVLTVRTCCRYTANGCYSPITGDTAIKAEHEHICRDCAVQELKGELSFASGLMQAA